MTLPSNRDLYVYLVQLATKLKERGLDRLSDRVALASRHASDFPSTEFIFESHLTLTTVLEDSESKISDTERKELRGVIDQLLQAAVRRD